MTQPYKLKDEIKAFIVEKKKSNPIISCRQLVPLVWEHFQLQLSKSSVNAILKEYQLSSHVGRRRIRPPKTLLIKPLDLPKLVNPSPEKTGLPVQVPVAAPAESLVQPSVAPSAPSAPLPIPESIPEPAPVPKKKEIELISTRRDIEYVVNCGCFLLRAADLKACFTDSLADQIANLLPGLKREVIYFALEALIYKQIFKSDNDLWRFLGSELDTESFTQITERLTAIDISNLQSNSDRLQKLNALVKELFFPAAYQLLDFNTMYSRFFCLIGRLERKGTLLAIRLFYPPNFQWAYDIVWQDDFQNAVNKVNQERIMTPEGEKIWFDANIGFQK